MAHQPDFSSSLRVRPAAWRGLVPYFAYMVVFYAVFTLVDVQYLRVGESAETLWSWFMPPNIAAFAASRTVETIADIERCVTSALTKHMWTELGPHWAEYTDGAAPSTVAQVLISRLARILDEDREQKFTAHPSHRYIYPPALEMRAPGDVVREPGGDWWVVLTPACDFEQKKYEFVLLARAGALDSHQKYIAWTDATAKGGNGRSQWNDLRKVVLMATQGRYHYLPAFRDIPDLVVDLENVCSVTADVLEVMEPVASLVSPFSEALLVQHSHFRGRIGVPDLDPELIKNRLESTPPVSA